MEFLVFFRPWKLLDVAAVAIATAPFNVDASVVILVFVVMCKFICLFIVTVLTL